MGRVKDDREHLTCPNCGEKTLVEHGTKPGEHRWFFCRSCGDVIKPFQIEEGDVKDEYTNEITLKDAVETLKRWHKDAVTNPNVRKPCAFALYHAWREVEDKEMDRRMPWDDGQGSNW